MEKVANQWEVVLKHKVQDDPRCDPGVVEVNENLLVLLGGKKWSSK